MKSKPKELREAAVKAIIEKKITLNEAIDLFQTSRAVLYSWLAVFKKEGRLEAKKPTGRKPIITEEISQKLMELIQKNNDITLEELREAIGGIVHITTIHKHLAALGYKLKKNAKSRGTATKGRNPSPEGLAELSREYPGGKNCLPR